MTRLSAAPAPTKNSDGMRLVILETSFAGEVERDVAYARAAIADCLRRGEAPIIPQLLYTQHGAAEEAPPEDQHLASKASLAWNRAAEAAVFYVDLGMSSEMMAAWQGHHQDGRIVEPRALPGWTAQDASAVKECERAEPGGQNYAHTRWRPLNDSLRANLDWNAPARDWNWRTARNILISIGVEEPTKSDTQAAGRIIRGSNGGRARRSSGRSLLFCPPPLPWPPRSLPRTDNRADLKK